MTSAAAAVEALLAHMLRGERVAVLAEDQELSPTDVAAILGISRPLVILRMDRGDLPFRYVGKHRRALLKDVLSLKSRLDVRQAAIDACRRYRGPDPEPWPPNRLSRSMMPASSSHFICGMFLIQRTFDGLVEARWTDDIHSEWMCNLAPPQSGGAAFRCARRTVLSCRSKASASASRSSAAAELTRTPVSQSGLDLERTATAFIVAPAINAPRQSAP
jgi:hypothetical protein